MLAKMALQPNHTACEVAGFSGFLVTGVRFRFNKFPPSNMQVPCSHMPHNHGIFFSIGEQVEHIGRLWIGERLWPVLALSQLAGKKKMAK